MFLRCFVYVTVCSSYFHLLYFNDLFRFICMSHTFYHNTVSQSVSQSVWYLYYLPSITVHLFIHLYNHTVTLSFNMYSLAVTWLMFLSLNFMSVHLWFWLSVLNELVIQLDEEICSWYHLLQICQPSPYLSCFIPVLSIWSQFITFSQFLHRICTLSVS